MRVIITIAALVAGANAFAADAVRGKQIFQACAACHGDKGGDLGPSLVGVVNRKAGARDDYRYSGPMSRSGLTWDEATLKAFIHEPQEIVRGTRMPFGGMDDAADIDDLVAFLVTLK
jgi:cytochrome c